MKKSLKIGLITGVSILTLCGARAGLTKIGAIPNWLDIEILCPGIKCEKIEETSAGYTEKCCKGWGFDCYEEHIYKNKNGFGQSNYGIGAIWKPIIYLYPTTITQIQVKLGTPENLSHTYPKYNSNEGRNVIAQPNGDLEDIKTGRKLYALYREGISENKPEITEGFVVKGEDTISFLEEKLAILGLNEREAEEFIVYWLPQMENNPYNLIRFESIQQQNDAMPLNITPTPDTVIRVMMDWKPIKNFIDIPEQILTTPERNGFTVVERGGSKL